jgi:hypothetical protein
VSPTSSVHCCSSARALRGLLEGTPATIVQVRVLPIPSMFPSDLQDATSTLPFHVSCAVAPPSVAEALGVRTPLLGELLLFSGAKLLARIAADMEDKPQCLLGLLTAGIAPWLGRSRRPEHEYEYEYAGQKADPFAVIGVPSTAAFDEVHAAWRQKLAEYQPDRFARAGEKIRRLATAETQRINAAFQAISRAHSAARRS